MSIPTAISLTQVSKRYEVYARPLDRLKQAVLRNRRYFTEFWALRDLSVDIPQGQAVGIVGRNGSGKSTLLQILCGVLTPTTGTAMVEGEIAALLELGSGFNPDFTGRENIRLNAAILGFSAEETRAREDAIIDFSGIRPFIDQPVKTYSSGMAMRLGFAVAVASDPAILVVDEALAVGDEAFQRKCIARIEEMRANGATVLFVTHSSRQVLELCDRALLLDSGELLQDGTPHAVIKNYQRVMYAAPAALPDLRAAIKGGPDKTQVSQTQATQPKAEAAPSHTPPASLDEAYFDDLRPETTIVYDAEEATILSVDLLSGRTGQPANQLLVGQPYRLRLSIRADRPVDDLRITWSIKSIAGTPMATGAFPPPTEPGLSLEAGGGAAGGDYTVEIAFTLPFRDGSYFVNVGLQQWRPEHRFVHRIVDALMFRAIAPAGSLSTGMVDLAAQGTIAPTLPS